MPQVRIDAKVINAPRRVRVCNPNPTFYTIDFTVVRTRSNNSNKPTVQVTNLNTPGDVKVVNASYFTITLKVAFFFKPEVENIILAAPFLS